MIWLGKRKLPFSFWKGGGESGTPLSRWRGREKGRKLGEKGKSPLRSLYRKRKGKGRLFPAREGGKKRREYGIERNRKVKSSILYEEKWGGILTPF